MENDALILAMAVKLNRALTFYLSYLHDKWSTCPISMTSGLLVLSP